MDSKWLIAIHGPTGIGKTSLAIGLAQHFETEIISTDSRQFFRELNIGVARPSPEELSAVVHHFIAFLSIQEEYSAGRFASQALKVMSRIFEKKDVIIAVGGSGLYNQALISGLDELPSDPAIRQELVSMWKQDGIASLQEELFSRDPEYYSQVDLSNAHRLIRALEVCRLSGQQYSSLRKGEAENRDFRVIQIALTAEREFLYDRINDRVLSMIEKGLEAEARQLLSFRHLNALNTVGYKEMFDYFDGIVSRDQAISLIQQHTRQYAKRQLTWLRRMSELYWIKADGRDNPADLAIDIIQKVRFENGF